MRQRTAVIPELAGGSIISSYSYQVDLAGPERVIIQQVDGRGELF